VILLKFYLINEEQTVFRRIIFGNEYTEELRRKILRKFGHKKWEIVILKPLFRKYGRYCFGRII